MEQSKKFITVKNAEIFYRNFSGKAYKYNPEGRRNFCLILDPEDAEKMAADGWNVKYTKHEDPKPYIAVAVNFESKYPPVVKMYGSRGAIVLDEKSVRELDYAEIEKIDLTINPRYSEAPDGSQRVKGYLRSMYVTVVTDELEDEYRDYERRYSEDENDDEPPFDV